jgi:hypothetical protein
LGKADNGHLCPQKSSYNATQQPDRPSSQNYYPVTGFDVRIVDQGVVGDTAWLSESGLFERQIIRQAVQAADRDSDKTRHRAVYPVAESLSSRIQVVEASLRQRRVRIDHSRGFTDNAVPGFYAAYTAPHFHNCSSKFMAQHYRVVDRPTVGSSPLVDIGTTYRNGTHFQDHIVGTRDRLRDIPEFDTKRFF